MLKYIINLQYGPQSHNYIHEYFRCVVTQEAIQAEIILLMDKVILVLICMEGLRVKSPE